MRIIKQNKTKKEEQKYKKIVKMVNEAQEEVYTFVKKNIDKDAKPPMQC